MQPARAYDVQVRLHLRVLARDEDGATEAVSTDLVERLIPLLEELHASDPRFSGFRLHADELVQELE